MATHGEQLKAIAAQSKKVNDEIRARNAELKVLKERKAKLDADMLTIMKRDAPNGFKMDGQVFLKKDQVVRVRRKPQEKSAALRDVLKEFGLSESPGLVDKLLETSKGVKTVRPAVVQQSMEW